MDKPSDGADKVHRPPVKGRRGSPLCACVQSAPSSLATRVDVNVRTSPYPSPTQHHHFFPKKTLAILSRSPPLRTRLRRRILLGVTSTSSSGAT
jgi:hypothetical protein